MWPGEHGERTGRSPGPRSDHAGAAARSSDGEPGHAGHVQVALRAVHAGLLDLVLAFWGRFAAMKLGSLVVAVPLLVTTAHAGGLFLPGSGATSTSRAGAAVASADDGEALSINPAGLAKTTGTTITISTTFIRYFMEFTRRGNYDTTSNGDPYEGMPYPTIENDPKPPLGIAKFQPIPVVA